MTRIAASDDINTTDLPPGDMGPSPSPSPRRKRRRVLITLPGDGCAAVAEDLGVRPPKFVSLLFTGFEVAERRYSNDEAVARGHARAMLDEHGRRVRGAA